MVKIHFKEEEEEESRQTFPHLKISEEKLMDEPHPSSLQFKNTILT